MRFDAPPTLGLPISGASDPRLSAPLLELHAAIDAEALWRAAIGTLRVAMPAFHYVMGMATVGLKPFVLRTTLPVPNEPDYWEKLNQVAPLEKIIERNVGRKVGRMSDDVPLFLLRLTPFYRRFMKPEGWRHSAAMFFWDGDRFLGHIAQNRTSEQGDYTDAEMRLLEELYPHFDTALRRVILFDRERSGRVSMEETVSRSPIPSAILDWDLVPLFHNAACVEATAIWRLGVDAARAVKPDFLVPEDVAAACRDLRQSRERSIIDGSIPPPPREVVVRHSSLESGIAAVRLLDSDDVRLSHPRFLLQFSLLRSKTGVAPSANLQALAHLTSAERDVALLAAEGLSNDEIGARLSISTSTVRTHLRQVFKKLGIDSRSRLAALLHVPFAGTSMVAEPENERS